MASAAYQLVVESGPSAGKSFDLEGEEYSIGRDLNADIALSEPSLSRRHARVCRQGNSYTVEDLGSTNGTFVNGEPVGGQRLLRPGDKIALGEKVVLLYALEDLEAGEGATVVLRTPVVPKTERLSAAEVAATTGGAPAGTPTRDHAAEHKALFTRWFQELWNNKNYAITQELVHPEFTAHGAGGQDIKQGPDGVAGMVKVWHGAFPDGHMTMDDIITEGEYSVIRMTFSGTHKGDFYGVPPSNKVVSVTSIGIDRVVDGKITEGWGELDMLGMMQQMGAFPAPAAAPAQETFTIEAAVSPEHVLEAYAALGSGDINRIREYWTDEMVWQVPGHNELSGWYYSLDEFLAFMGRVGELSGHSFRMTPVAGKVLVTGDYSVDLTRNQGRRADNPNKTMDIEVAHVLRWRNGKVIAGKGAIFGDGTTEYDQFWGNSPAVTPPTH